MADRKRKAWRRGSGSVRLRAGRWYIRYCVNGQRYEDATEAESRREAEAMLRHKLDGLESGRISVESHQTRVRDLWALIQDDYRAKEQRVEDLAIRWKHLDPAFGHTFARDLTYLVMNRYVVHRLNEGAAPSSVRNEIACLRRMVRLGVMNGLVSVLPVFPSVRVDNARQVFWEPEEFRRILKEVPDYMRPMLVMVFWTGFRAKELLKLEWRHVDLATGRVELLRKMTKNREFKTIYLPKKALEALRDWRKTTEELMASRHSIIPSVFHRNGEPIKSFRTAWDNARMRAGMTHKHLHDFRRTMTRNLMDAEVDEQTSMKITGHKTRNVYDRYNIRNEADLIKAAKKLSKLGQ